MQYGPNQKRHELKDPNLKNVISVHLFTLSILGKARAPLNYDTERRNLGNNDTYQNDNELSLL